MMSIGQLAKISEISIQSIRFYERSGLIPEPQRKPSGYRMYEADTVQILLFIKRTRHLGFSLDDIKSLLDLRVTDDNCCETVKKKAEAHLATVSNHIQALQSIANVLRDLVDCCAQNQHPQSLCPVLDAFQNTDPL